MALNIKREKNYVKRFSDAKAWIIECESNGTFAAGATWEELPHMSAPKMEAKEETAELKDGSNATIFKSNTLDCYEFNCELLQADKATLGLIKNSRDKLYMLIYQVGKVNGLLQYWFFAPGNISSTGGPDTSDFIKVPFVFTSLKNDDTIEPTNLPADIPTTLQSKFEIAESEQMVIIEETKTTP